MRRLAASIPAVLALALATAPSLAADESVQATTSNTFSPASVTIAPGESVTWTNVGGNPHNVHFDDGFTDPPTPSSSNWTTKRTFDAPGDYRYHCDFHGTAMSGRVVVMDPNAPPPDTTAPDIDSLRVNPSTFCNKASDMCPKRGARLRFSIDEAAAVAGTIIRRKDGKRVGTLKLDAKVGSNDVKFTGRGLKNGKYLLQLVATDAAANKSAVNKPGFKIAPSG